MTTASEMTPIPTPGDDLAGRGSRAIRIFGFVMVVAALATAAVSFLVLTGQTQIAPSPEIVRYAGIANGIVVCGLAAIVAYEVFRLIEARRHQQAGSRLHVRIVALFSIATLPTILLAFVASITLDRGLDRWFADRTSAIVETSRNVAQAYVEEHSRVLAIDLLAIAGEFNRVSPDIGKNREVIASYLTNQGRLRGLSAISLIHRDRTTIVAGTTTTNFQVPPPPVKIFDDADSGKPSLIAPGTTNLVGGVLKLENRDDTYLYLARPIDPVVTRYVRLTNENADEYQQLVANRYGVQIAFAILFLGMALVVLLSAIWIGLGFADRLVAPIRQLITAAGEISSGNLDVRVPVKKSTGDIASLAQTFNGMSGQLKSQRDELLNTNSELDEKNRFTEAVLSGVSAGVIGLDDNNRVNLVNRSASDVLSASESDVAGKAITEILPEIEPILAEISLRTRSEHRGQIQIVRAGEQRTLNVQITRESSVFPEEGLVVTLDDITDLASAQRRSAWADVARRIAHEIKNPLTPIQLSAERLKRRYLPLIEQDNQTVFNQCTDTIVRQVGDIRRMVDEFSSFARMPKPVMEDRDINAVIKEAAFLQEVANPELKISVHTTSGPLIVQIDHRLVTQALTNIVKNATESIESAVISENEKGEIDIRVRAEPESVTIDVEDNGRGLPESDRESLLEPYMTTREKGTGLGLAIVRKIMEEHSGSIVLLDRQGENSSKRGACVRLTFPRAKVASETGSDAISAMPDNSKTHMMDEAK